MFSLQTPFAVNVVHEDGSLVLALSGELDLATAPVLRRVVAELVSPHLKVVTLDLGALTFVDVAGLRACLQVQQMTAGAYAGFRLRSVNEFTLRLIRLVGLDELETAVAAFPAMAPQ